MEPISLHPFDPTLATRFAAVLTGAIEPDERWAPLLPLSLAEDLRISALGDERAANRISLAFVQVAALEHPAFFHDGLGLTTWEARVDRGIGMLMRPPSRLFVDAGLDRRLVATMPIRLDLQGGLMGGAWVPPRLIDQLLVLFDGRLDRMARRLHEAEYDPYALLGMMHRAVSYAADHRLGLVEAIGVVGPGGEHYAGTQVVVANRRDMDPVLMSRIEVAITPPREPGLLSRLFGRKPAANGLHSEI